MRGDEADETVIIVLDMELSGAVDSDSLEESVHFSTCLVFPDHDAIADASQRVLESLVIIRRTDSLRKLRRRIESLV